MLWKNVKRGVWVQIHRLKSKNIFFIAHSQTGTIRTFRVVLFFFLKILINKGIGDFRFQKVPKMFFKRYTYKSSNVYNNNSLPCTPSNPDFETKPYR